MSNLPQSELVISGQFYSGNSSDRQDAQLRSADGAVLISAGAMRLALSQDQIRISPRIGDTPRYLHLPDDAVFETNDNKRVDQLSRSIRKGRGGRMLHYLEHHLGLILVAVVVTIAASALTFVHGVPWTARLVAQALPAAVAEQLGETTLMSLDETWLAPSELPESRLQELRQSFLPYLAPVSDTPLKVVFRASDTIGANALALPDGTVIFTDDLVSLAEHDDELIAILTHEIGHVAHRHGLQGMVQSSLTFWLFVMMTGDLSAFSDTTVAVPAVLMSLSYSREMERQADAYALQTMESRGLDPAHFANILDRLSESHGMEVSDTETSHWDQLGDLLSSHPATRERIEQIRQQNITAD